MNIVEMESPFVIQAKTVGHKQKRNVIYSVENSYHSICIDKRGILLEQTCLWKSSEIYWWQDWSDNSWKRNCWLETDAWLDRMIINLWMLHKEWYENTDGNCNKL